MSINKKDYTIVAKELIHELTDDITGNNEEWLFGKIPSEHVMIGMIDGEHQDDSFLVDQEIDNKRMESIPSIGLRFRVPKKTKDICISLQGKLFYRVAPTYNEQSRYLINKYSKNYGEEFNDSISLLKYIEFSKRDFEYKEPNEKIVNIYKSILLSDIGEFCLEINDLNNSLKKVNKNLTLKLEAIIDSIKEFSIGCKTVLRPLSSMLDEKNLMQF